MTSELLEPGVSRVYYTRGDITKLWSYIWYIKANLKDDIRNFSQNILRCATLIE